MWSVTKADVQQTLANVCMRVLHDHSVTPESRAKRAKGLLLLGEEYCKCGVPAGKGIEDFLSRMGMQTGMWGPEAPKPNGESTESEDHSSNSSSPFNPSGLHPRFATEDKVLACLGEVDALSIKELKVRIEQLKGSADGCIEKSDIRRRLKVCCCKLLSVEALRKHVASQAEGVIDVKDADRDMLTDMILQM